MEDEDSWEGNALRIILKSDSKFKTQTHLCVRIEGDSIQDRDLLGFELHRVVSNVGKHLASMVFQYHQDLEV